MHELGFNHFTNYGKRLGWIGFETFSTPIFTYKQMNFLKLNLSVKDSFFAIVSTITCKPGKPLNSFLNMAFERLISRFILFKSIDKPNERILFTMVA